MRVKECALLYNYQVKKGYYLMGFNCPDLATAKPGQFMTISVEGIETTMPLRRPFTFYRIKGDVIEVLYKVVGRGTRLFATLKEGDKINVLGPLGNKFKVYEDKKVLLLARGVGLASLACLGDTLKKNSCNITTIGSFKDEESNIVDDYVKEFSDKLIVVNDEDKSSDVDRIEALIEEINPDLIYTCGSKRLVRMLQEMDYTSYVTLEERMACGLGSCLTCAVKTKEGYKRVCMDGPCFDVQEVEI